MEKKSFQDVLREEWEKWKRLDGKGRWDYFTSYYLQFVLIGLFLLLCLLFWLSDIRESRRELVLSGIVVNGEPSPEGTSLLTEDFLAYREESTGKKAKRARIFLGQEYILFEGAEDALDQYRRVMALTAQVAAGELDYLILDRNALTGLAGTGIMIDPEGLVSEDILTALEKDLVTVEGGVWEEGGEPERFRVLSLKGTPFAALFTSQEQELYLAFTPIPKREGKVGPLMEYLWQKGMLAASLE